MHCSSMLAGVLHQACPDPACIDTDVALWLAGHQGGGCGGHGASARHERALENTEIDFAEIPPEPPKPSGSWVL